VIQARKLDALYERGYAVVVDKHGIAKDLPSPSGRFPAVSTPDQQEFTATVNEFWFEAAHIPKYLVRGDLWVARFRDWTMKTLLLKVLEWRAVTKGESPVDVWYIGSHIKEWVEPEIWGELQKVFSHFDSKDSWRGLLATTALFRRVSLELAEQAGLVYPNEIDRRVSQHIAGFEGRF
jgi:aminoglycoside 6-adenylyltransferase